MGCCERPLAEVLSARLFKALSEPNRLALVLRLAEADCECTVSEMTSCCEVDLSVVSRHLKVLRHAGVVEARRDGKQVRYRLRREALAELFGRLADAFACPAEPPNESG